MSRLTDFLKVIQGASLVAKTQLSLLRTKPPAIVTTFSSLLKKEAFRETSFSSHETPFTQESFTNEQFTQKSFEDISHEKTSFQQTSSIEELILEIKQDIDSIKNQLQQMIELENQSKQYQTTLQEITVQESLINKSVQEFNKPINKSIEEIKSIQEELNKPIQEDINKPIQEEIKPIQEDINKPIQEDINKPIQEDINKPIKEFIQKNTEKTIQELKNEPKYIPGQYAVRDLKQRKVPSSSFSRASHFASLGIRLAAGASSEYLKRSIGLSKQTTSAFLSESNIQRLTDTLCRMRGAALKLGQMLSIQDEALIPPEFQKILERVRHSANIMPSKQLEKVMSEEFGTKNWREKFKEFEDLPIAAASIGQVHRAVLHDGREVAVKVQYPGVAQSIESDINNLKMLVTNFNIIPKGAYIESTMQQLGSELRLECDYLNEAQNQKKYKQLLSDFPDVIIPDVIDELTTKRVLTTEFIHGLSIEQIQDQPLEIRNRVIELILKVVLKELFEFKFMQTDPNWSNFFYNLENNKLYMIDFGACLHFSKKFVDQYMRVVYAAAKKDYNTIIDASRKMGFLTGDETEIMNQAHAKAAEIVARPFATNGPYDFRNQTISSEMHKIIPVMLKHRLTPPPVESYSLHRKLSGCFLLSFKLKTVLDCQKLFAQTFEKYEFEDPKMKQELLKL